MTEAALQELIKREFPAEMSVTEVADKLDTMQAHPDIEQIRTWFNNVLLDVITLDYLEYSEKTTAPTVLLENFFYFLNIPNNPV